MYMMARNKSCLERRNDIRQKRLEPIGQQLGNNLINNITKTNRTIMMNNRSSNFFRNKSYKSMVLFR
jgi:hypothetical protein